MKIVGISSSPRVKNSNTLKLLNAALEGAKKAGAEGESIDVAKLNINIKKPIQASAILALIFSAVL